MKFLFKLIFLPILTIVIIPLIFLAFMYKSVEIPEDDYTGTIQSTDLMGMISEDFDTFLETHDHDTTLGINIAQGEVNQLLLNQFRAMNEDYLVDGAEDDDRLYVMKEPMFGYQGTWVRFEDNTIEIESGVHAFVSNFTFKTALLITFKADIGTDEVVLKLDKLNVGNLPLAWLFGPVDWVVEKATGQSIETIINEQLDGLATFDPQTREIRLVVQDLVDQALAEDPEKQQLVQALLAFVDENELIDISFEEGEFNAGFGLGKIWEENYTPYTIANDLVITSDADIQEILAAQASSLILSTLTADEGLFIAVDQLTLNRIFDYFLSGQKLPSGAIQEQEIMEGYLMQIMMPYVEMEDTQFMVNIPLIITKTEDPVNYRFVSVIRVDATTSVVGNDLYINLDQITAGDGTDPVTLGGEFLSDILALVGQTGDGFIQDGAFVIEDFYTTLNTDTFSINNIAVVNSKLRLYIDVVDLGLPLDEIGDVVQGVLEVLDNPEYPAELSDGIDDLLTELADPQGDPEQAVQDLVDIISDLDPEDQAALYTDLLAAMGDVDGFDYEGLFDLLP